MIRCLGVVAVLLLALSGCLADGPEGSEETVPSYEPIPDDDLYADIRELSEVSAVDIGFVDTWPDHAYRGHVTIEPGANAQAVLDHVYAILRQGRPGASITVGAYQGDREVRFERLGGGVGTPPALEERYGPQPGDGTPPGD